MPGGVIVGVGTWSGTWLGVSGAAGLAVWALATPAIMPTRMSTSTRVQRARKAMTAPLYTRRCMFLLLHNSAQASNLFRRGKEDPDTLFPRVSGQSPSPLLSPAGRGDRGAWPHRTLKTPTALAPR